MLQRIPEKLRNRAWIGYLHTFKDFNVFKIELLVTIR